VVLAAAGSSRPAANAAVARAASAWQSARSWRAVVPAYASAASPTPAQAVTALLRAGAPRVLVATYLLAPGRFADQVRESSLAAGAAAVSAPLGAALELADVIIERYLQAVAAPRRAADPARALGPSVS
jgi:sirohydrochlorin ferrochelatase